MIEAPLVDIQRRCLARQDSRCVPEKGHFPGTVGIGSVRLPTTPLCDLSSQFVEDMFVDSLGYVESIPNVTGTSATFRRGFCSLEERILQS